MLEHSTACTTKLSFSEQSFKERKDKAEKTIISTTALNLFFSAHWSPAPQPSGSELCYTHRHYW